jgi:MFS family permease
MFFAVTNRFLHWMVIGLISPVLILLMLSKNITLPQSGIVMSVLSVFVVVFELPSGIISDKIGRKKIYLFSQCVFLLSFLILLFADDYLSVLCSFVLFGIARAFSSGSIEADFVDNYLKKNDSGSLGRLLSGMGLGETLGLAIGALVGGFLPTIAKVLIPGSNEFSLNVFSQIILTVILLSTTILFHTTNHEDKHVSVSDFLKESVSMIRSSVVLRVLLTGVFIWGFAFLSIELYWQPRLKEILIDKTDTAIYGYLNSLYFVFAAVGTMVIGKILTKYTLKNLHAIIAIRIALGAFLVFLAYQNTALFFSLFYLLIMGANGMLSVPESVMFNAAIPGDKRSSLLSLSSLMMQLGGIFSSLIFSSLVSVVGIKVIWVISGLLFSLSSVIYFMNRKRIGG